jgi:hypothetical protein
VTDDRSSQRLIVLGLVALGLAGASIALWLGLRDDGASAQPSATGSASAPAAHTATPAPALPGSGGAPVVTEVPRRARPPQEPALESVVDGVRIRDHRKGAVQPADLPPTLRPPDARKLSSETVAAINRKVLRVVVECAAGVPKEVRGDNPRLEGQILVNVKAGQVSVAQSTVLIRRVSDGTAAERAKQCVEQRALGLTAAAVAGEGDVENYSIQLSYALP